MRKIKQEVSVEDLARVMHEGRRQSLTEKYKFVSHLLPHERPAGSPVHGDTVEWIRLTEEQRSRYRDQAAYVLSLYSVTALTVQV